MSNSTGLSAASANKLRRELTSLAHKRVFPVVVETALYAIFTILICTSTYILWKRGLRHSRTNCLMLAATLAMYALSALDWAIDIRLLWNDLRTLRFYGLPDAPASGPFGLSSPPLLVLQGITSVICIILGDAVVCWRVCVVWANDRRMVAGALFWVIGSIGVFTTFSVMFVGFYYDRVPDAIQTLVDHSEVVNAFSFSWSAATNVWATSMIAYKAWLQRRDLGRYISSTGMAVQNVFTLMVDVGIIYTIFMLLNVIVLTPSLTDSAFFFYVTLFMQQITGMYPTALIVFVALQKSYLEHQFTYPPPPGPASQTESMPFTVNVPHATYTSTVGTTTTTTTEYDRDKPVAARMVALRAGSLSTSRGESEWEKGVGGEGHVEVEAIGLAR